MDRLNFALIDLKLENASLIHLNTSIIAAKVMMNPTNPVNLMLSLATFGIVLEELSF